jgi:hypothetical protein
VLGTGLLMSALIALVPWVHGGRPLKLGHPALGFGLAGGTALLACWAAAALAPAWHRRAWLAVVALERERPIFIERTGPGPLEAALGRTLTGPYRALYAKDIANLRRRFPASYWASGALMVAALAVGAFVRSQTALWILAPILGALALYQVVLADRLVSPPAEQPRLLERLPLERTRCAAAKRRYLSLRIVFCVMMPAVAAVFRGPAPVLTAGAVGMLAVTAWVAGSLRVSSRKPRARE